MAPAHIAHGSSVTHKSQSIGPDRRSRRTNRQHFGMRGRIMPRAGCVGGGGDDAPVEHHHRANRNLSRRCGIGSGR
jgi:hypothetical protein